MSKSMTEGNPLKLILLFTIPLLLGNLFQQFYNIVDTAIVGQTLGSSALASVGASSSVQFLVLGFCMGTCQGFAIPVAQRFGAKDYDNMQKYIYNGAIWTTIIAVIVTLLSVLLCPTILHILQVNDEIYANAYAYLVVIFIGIPCTLLYNYLSALLRSVGDSKTPFYFLAFSAILNIFLDLFCILVLHWGCAGAAIATIVSQGISGLLCLNTISRKVKVLHIAKENRKYNCEITNRLLINGLPMGLQFSITAIGSMVMQSANNSLGTTYVSAFTAGLKIKQLMMCPFDALGVATSTFLSQNYGALKADRIKTGSKTGILLGIGYGIIAGLIMIVFGRVMCMLFVSASESAVLDAAALYLARMGYFYPVVGALIVCRMSVQGLGYSGRAVVGGILEMLARSLVATIFVPLYGYNTITFTDQAAWVAALIYLIPVIIITINHITKQIQIDLSNA